jgi:hypothetical protein
VYICSLNTFVNFLRLTYLYKKATDISDETIRTKLSWTFEMAQYAKDVIPHLKNIERGYPLFWYNPHQIRGFRLTQKGFDILSDRYPNWPFPVAYKNLTPSEIVLLDMKSTVPWFLSRSSFITFDSNLASAMALSNNNIDSAVQLVYC